MVENTFDMYQRAALTTAIFSEDVAVIYPTLGLVSEAGEVADKIKKILRDKEGIFTDDDKHAIMKELGDVLWYVAVLSNKLGFDLSSVANVNLEKLSSRQQRSKIKGSGDDR